MIAAGGALVMGVALFDVGWRTGLDHGPLALRVFYSAGHCANLAKRLDDEPFCIDDVNPPTATLLSSQRTHDNNRYPTHERQKTLSLYGLSINQGLDHGRPLHRQSRSRITLHYTTLHRLLFRI